MAAAAICFAPADAAFAAEAAHYLNLHAGVLFDLAESRGPDDFLDAIEQCLASEFVIVVLSPSAVPALWHRSLWESVLIAGAKETGSRIAYLLRENCAFPQVLKRHCFFDSANDGLRALRRWFIQQHNPERHPPEIETEGDRDEALLSLLDAPGLMRNVSRAAASWMVRHCWRDFEALYWVDCAYRTRAGILGELAHAMKLRLPGTADQNWLGLRECARQERSLFVLEHLDEEFECIADLGGKASVMVLAPEDLTEPATFAMEQADCWRALRLLQQQDRLAEAHELLTAMAGRAKKEGDLHALEQIQWEERWILNKWDLPAPERTELTKTQPSQLWLPLPGSLRW